MHKYVGWVPNLSGRLSFSAVGSSDHPTRVERSNVLFDGCRYLIAYQKRNLSDTTLPLPRFAVQLIDRFWFRKSTSLVFVLMARGSEAADELQGNVLIFKASAWKNYGDRSVDRALRQLNAFVLDVNFNLQEPVERKAELDRTLDESLTVAASRSAANISFRLQRDGVCRLYVGNDNIIDPIYPNLVGSTEAVRLDVVAQAYFFLRDITHTHQHHSPTSDNLLDIYPDNGTSAWQTEILYSLFRAIIAFRRRGGLSHHYFALGMLSYAQAFINTFNKSNDDLPKYNFEEVRHSLNASIGSKESVHNEIATRQAITGFLSICVAISALVIGVVLSIASFGKPIESLSALVVNPGYIYVARFVAERPIVTTLLLGAFYFGIYKLFVGPAGRDLTENRYARNLVRLVVAFPKWRAVAILALLSSMFVCAGFYLITLLIK